ncbi:hypothetical protein [Macrococcoides caseolyticum]|uniref:hypothetical protein n=1 Tax=Macrococcoides caseolyticum TaxID=69966 RepID=UPI000C322D7A|nr:hypothetical protein [Macrococcus caseolyticus]PKE64229.1 hypothetical protein CW683_01245 [Macrococcus caseolyticus]
MTYTTEQIKDIINNYPIYIKRIFELKRSYYENIMGGNTALYGIEATLPKGNGSNSDPVFNEINRILKTDKTIIRLENKVKYIQNRWDRVIDERMAIVLSDKLSGYTIYDSAEKLDCSPQRISQIFNEIAELLKD